MRTLPYPLPPLGTALMAAAAALGVMLSLLFAVVTLPILALLRMGTLVGSIPQTRRHPRTPSRGSRPQLPHALPDDRWVLGTGPEDDGGTIRTNDTDAYGRAPC